MACWSSCWLLEAFFASSICLGYWTRYLYALHFHLVEIEGCFCTAQRLEVTTKQLLLLPPPWSPWLLPGGAACAECSDLLWGEGRQRGDPCEQVMGCGWTLHAAVYQHLSVGPWRTQCRFWMLCCPSLWLPIYRWCHCPKQLLAVLTMLLVISSPLSAVGKLKGHCVTALEWGCFDWSFS